ncbi:hypothetical protein L3Q82_012024 [Scortum barcoo]|uniref:Uncharacterized protein n=1 Tax=Scortum barcoo TaxID=214431 RepID=A0ACB8W6I0_9TELE|nr:hypothetical protein L3Q82_012024 [Scortum barcoo]
MVMKLGNDRKDKISGYKLAEMSSFLRRVAGRSLRDRLRWLGHLFRMPPGRLPREVFQVACPTGRRPSGKTQDTLEKLCLSAGLGTPLGPPGRAGGSVWGEGSLGISAQTAASSDPVPDQADEEDEEEKMKDIGHCVQGLNGSMRRSLQPTQVAQVVQLIQDGTSMRAVARRFAVSVSVVSRAWRRYQETGQYIRRRGGGRRRATTQQQDLLPPPLCKEEQEEHCQSPAK